MKKIALFVMALMLSVAANAQFEQGKGYLGASLSGFDISSQAKQFHVGLDAKAGYLFADNLMALAQVGFEHLKDSPDEYKLGVSGRYYIVQNGLYLGAGLTCKYTESDIESLNEVGKLITEKDRNFDLLPGVQIGYAFFLSRTVTVEPELYMDFSTKNFDNSCYGLRIGVGVYLFKDQYTFKR